jgi:ATP-dependent helicase/DNAse subunit B
MLTVVSGSYQPTLESALLSRFAALKKRPLDPVLIVTASSRLKEHLERLIARKFGSVLNVHFHTLGSLADTLARESGTLEKPVLSDPLFYDALVKNLIRRNKPFESFADLAVPEGFPSAVRSTLRDLLDAGVNESLVEEAMAEKFVGRDVDVGSLKELLTLYRLYLGALELLPLAPNAKVTEVATEHAGDSRFLKDCGTVLFYGFYDLTGRQVDFFEAIARAHASVLYFPYRPDDADFEFAKNFRETTLHRIGFEEASIPAESNGHKPEIEIFNVSGRHDEAWLAAKQIRRLLDGGTDPSEIAVVARNKERLMSLPVRLEEWKIPYVSVVGTSRLDHPETLDDIAALEGAFSAENKTSAFWTDLIKRSLEILPEERKEVREAVQSFEPFDLLKEKVTPTDFLEALKKRLSQTPWPNAPRRRGVSLLHAEAARGLSFKVLILIGMEERVFPRIVREDPFLRDNARFALLNTLGFKIGMKLTALQEERLLFRLLTDAAPRIIFIYQRSDDEGRVVGASPYLREYLHQRGEALSTKAIPRSPLEKLEGVAFTDLSSADVVMALLAESRDAEAAALVSDGDAFLESLAVQRALQKFNEPSAFDGLIGSVTWGELFRKGGGMASASALESYGKCPWQFFAVKMLGLEEDQVSDRTELPNRDRGTVVHGFLEEIFKTLTNDGRKSPPVDLPEKTFEAIFTDKIPETFGAAFGLPAGLWAILRIDLKETLREYLAGELRRLATEAGRPVLFEKEWQGSLEAPLDGGPWRGAIDRIDQIANGVEVVDYKTGGLVKSKVELDAVRGRRAQPPLYLLMAEKILKTGPFQFSYHQVRGDLEKKDFGAKEWETHRSAILKTIRGQIDLMKKGIFPVIPDAGTGERYCDYCDVARICRKHHSVSAYRASQGEGAAPAEFRKLTLKASSPKPSGEDPEVSFN